MICNSYYFLTITNACPIVINGKNNVHYGQLKIYRRRLVCSVCDVLYY